MDRKPQDAPEKQTAENAPPASEQKPAMEKAQEEAAEERENEGGYQ